MAIIDNLRVSEEALQTAISTYESKKDQLMMCCLKISNEVRVLDGSYHGEASEKFKAQFDDMYSNLQTNEAAMEDVISDLKKALSVYQDIEAEATSAFNALEEGTSYLG